MDISAGLIAKAGAGTAALAATTTGIVYSDTIAELLGISKAIDGGSVYDQSQTPDSVEKNSLGLPSTCTWPTVDSTPQTYNLGVDQLRTINFEGKTADELTVKGTGSVVLEIKKINGDNDEYNNYVFIFKNDAESEITVGNDSSNSLFSLKKGMNLEFKIKNENNKWSLEKVWNDDEIRNKIGLDCKTNNECTLKTDGKIVIKQGDSKSGEISTLDITGESKIKLQRDAKGYNQGLRFNIEGGDITLDNAGDNITKLEKNESYQIDQDGDKWLLARKTTATDAINKKLKAAGLPDTCKFSEGSKDKNCGKLTNDDLKAMNFDNKNGSVSGTVANADKVTLKLEKIDETDVFSNGIKIIFENENNPISSSELNINWKSGTNPEYKIDGGKLKEAWNMNKLAKKVNITCTNKTPTECTFGEKINLFKDDSNSVIGAKVTDHANPSKKIKIEKDQEGYNQGFKFTVESPISISEGTHKPDGSSIGEIEVASYEIKEQTVDGQKHWFLSKKESN